MRDAEDLEGREAYRTDDPKHPDFLEAWLDYADTMRKREKEEGPPPPPDPED